VNGGNGDVLLKYELVFDKKDVGEMGDERHTFSAATCGASPMLMVR
jgi:hypothetical protein